MTAFSNITLFEILVFLIPFSAAILIDLFCHNKGKEVTIGNAAAWSLIWVACSVLFGTFVWNHRGAEAGSLFYAGFVLEKALAIDNLFAFFLIFASFGLTTQVNQHYQHKILYWGILGAIVFRVLFLGMGAMIVNLSSYILIIFALIILWTVWKMWNSDEAGEVDYTQHWSVNLTKKFAKVNPSIDSGKFFNHGVTPLFLCLVCIECCDVIFAFDSMPTIIAVVRDPYLMITSSLWAAAGLRSLYFLLVAAQNKFWALPKAIMALLILVAAKLIMGAFDYHISHTLSFIIITTVLLLGIIVSLTIKQNDNTEATIQ